LESNGLLSKIKIKEDRIMRINHNVSANVAYRHLNETQKSLSTSLERLSSGLRINHAADDAAGLAISEKLRAQISGYNNAVQNAQDGISLLQTAEGALSRVHIIVRRIRDLSELAANGDKTDEDRSHYQEEVDQLLKEIDRISNTTEYNTRKLLDGTLGSSVEVVGDNDDVVSTNSVKIESSPVQSGEYAVQIVDPATKAKATFTSGAATATQLTVGDTFSQFVNGVDGTYTYKFDVDGKSVTVDLVAKTGAGDTIAEALTKINDAFKDAGVSAHANFNPQVATSGGNFVSGIEVESDKFGSAHDVRVSVINQPGTVYTDANYNAVDGTVGAIYNSDRSDATGDISSSTVIISDGTQENSAILKNAFDSSGDGESIDFSDGTNTYTLTVDAGDTIADVVNDINANAKAAGVDIQAIYDAKAGKLKILSNESYLKIKGSATNDQGDNIAVMLGVYGEYYAPGTIEGAKLSSTWDYQLNITAPDKTTATVYAKFGNRSSEFDAVESGSAITSSNIDPDITGSEQPGAGGITGISFTLKEKTYQGGEKFSFMVQKGDLVFQVGANGGSANRMSVSIDTMNTDVLKLKDLDISTQANAMNALDSGVLDDAINTISNQRAKLGAFTNRLNHTIANLSVAAENLTTAESRIRDADMAKETLAFTRAQILSQSGTAMLSKATQIPQMVLQLLQSI
jgi:flagellin